MLCPLMDLLFQGSMESTSAPPFAQWLEAERLLTDSTAISNVGGRVPVLVTMPPLLACAARVSSSSLCHYSAWFTEKAEPTHSGEHLPKNATLTFLPKSRSRVLHLQSDVTSPTLTVLCTDN